MQVFQASTIDPRQLMQLRSKIQKQKKADLVSWNKGEKDPKPYRLDFYIQNIGQRSATDLTADQVDLFLGGLQADYSVEYENNPSKISVVSFHLVYIVDQLIDFANQHRKQRGFLCLFP